MKKPSGIELIAKERRKQIRKGRGKVHDFNVNANQQLQWVAYSLLAHEFEEQVELDAPPENWSKEAYESLHERERKERLIIAGALIAAELDRIGAVEIKPISAGR